MVEYIEGWDRLTTSFPGPGAKGEGPENEVDGSMDEWINEWN